MSLKKVDKKNFLNYVNQVAQQYSLSNEKVSEFLKESFASNFLKEYPDNSIGIIIDHNKGIINMWKNLDVVTDEFFFGKGFEDEETITTISKAKEIKGYEKKDLKVGDKVKCPIDIGSFNLRLVKNILYNFQKLTLGEMNQRVYEEWLKYKGQVLEGMVEKIIENKDQTPREIIIAITAPDGSSTKGIISRFDLVQIDSKHGIKIYEKLVPGNIYYFLVRDVLENSVDCPIILTRTDGEIVKFLMHKHISEVSEGNIEIKLIARIAGIKTKVLVASKKKNLDPVGCCIGPKGKRLKYISAQLLNEKIDVILWSDNDVKNVINSFVPAKILGFRRDGDMEITLIATLENLLSAIGKKGVNAKLVYALTGWKINLKTIQEAKDEKIEYQAIDEQTDAQGSNLSNRIYEMHYMKNEDMLSKIEEISVDIDDKNINSNNDIQE